MMNVKGKIKEFKEKHPELKSDVSKLLFMAVGCGAGYIVGNKFCEWRISSGLERIDSVDPEILPKIEAAIETLKNK